MVGNMKKCEMSSHVYILYLFNETEQLDVEATLKMLPFDATNCS